MDGTLLDSEQYHIKAEIKTLKKFGLDITPDVAAEYLGFKMDDYINALARRFNKDLPTDEVLKQIDEIIERYYRKDIPLSPHVVEVLGRLKLKYKMALATSRDRYLAQIALDRFSLNQYFQAKVFAEDVEKGKPNPEIFLKT